MLRLRTLGGLTIEDENGPLAGAIARKRSLALLALIGLATEQGLSRDRVLGYLWPESDTDRARNNLKQTLFQLRQDLHEDVFARAPGVLRLETGVISVDACEFQAALDRNNPTTAVTLYRGPFLDGFYLPGLVEFEHWSQAERVRLAQRYAGALENLATAATRMGDHSGAAEWWRRLAAHEPLSARYAVGLMRSLAQGGDRGAALEHGRVHEEMVRQELESEPDPGVTDLMKELRGRFARWSRSPAPKPPIANLISGEHGAPGSFPIPAPPPPANPAETPAPTSPAPVARARRSTPFPVSRPAPPQARFRPSLLIMIGLFLLMVLGDWWLVRRQAPATGSPDLVAVFPFSFSGAAESRYLASGMVDLLSAGLDGAGRLRSVPPSVYLARIADRGDRALDPKRGRALASQLGAGAYVLGEIMASGSRVLIGAAMYDRLSEGPVARASVEGDAREIFDLVDRLAANLIASRYGTPGGRLSRVAASTTRSLPAFKAYLDGERAHSEGHEAQAIEAFQRALSIDSSFALAYYRLSDAADHAGRPELAQASADKALRFGERLGERERRLIQAQHAWRRGQGAEAERLSRSLVGDYPDDLEGWLLLADVLVQGNPLRGRSSVEARPALVQALARDPTNREALIRLVRLAYLEGNRQEVDTLLRRIPATSQGSDLAEARALAVSANQLEGSERFGRWLAAESQAPDLQGHGHRVLAQAALARGQWRQARREVELAARFDPGPALALRSLIAALSFIPLPRAEIVSAREAVQRWDPRTEASPYLRRHRLGLLDIRLGDTAAALGDARTLDRASDSSVSGRLAHTLAQSIRAHLAAAADRDAVALARLEAAGWEAAAPVVAAEAYDRFFRAELLERLGHEDEALGWYGSIAERAAYELVYLAPAERHQAEIYQRRGQRDLAARHYRRFIELWKDADPELQPLVTEARSRLEALE